MVAGNSNRRLVNETSRLTVYQLGLVFSSVNEKLMIFIAHLATYKVGVVTYLYVKKTIFDSLTKPDSLPLFVC